MIKVYRLLIFLFLVVLTHSSAQIKIVELPFPSIEELQSTIGNETDYRKILPLMNEWTVYVDDSKENATTANLPLYFEDSETLIFEKNFVLDPALLNDYQFELHCNGVNYSAEVLLNDVVVFKDDVAGMSFNLKLTKDLLKSSEENNLKIIIVHSLDDLTTIPSVQRFLFPKNRGGITKEVFIKANPQLTFICYKCTIIIY
jgi:hypothetical protein